ncbi:MAG: adenosylhomocysteinase [Candidatus Bipolaricaulota bacterium]
MSEHAVSQGAQKIDWARGHMPVLAQVEKRLAAEGRLAGLRVAISVHLEAKTARLALAFRQAGAEVVVTGSNPLSTQDDVAAALADSGVAVYAQRGVDEEGYRKHLEQVLKHEPHVVVDDGGDLTELLHGPCAAQGRELMGICEETTTGILRLGALSARGELRYPALAVNDARMKRLFDNRYGTGQSAWEAIMRSTNLSVAGKTVLVAGYGWCGRGIALRARGLGARVLVSEVDPVRAAEAHMDGFEAAPVSAGIRRADFAVTATGCRDVITYPHLEQAKQGVVLANAGHFDVEIDVASLRRYAAATSVRQHVTEFTLPKGPTVYLLAEGRLVNLVAGDGHPVEIMDLSFSLQALCVAWLAQHSAGLAQGVHSVPAEIDEHVARLFLRSQGGGVDELTPAQSDYLAGRQT